MVKVFGTHDAETVKQLETCIAAEENAEGVLCADAHVGYSMPIGGVVAYVDHISPSGVGYDIGCGNYAVKTPIRAAELSPNDWKGIAREINASISFGLGRKATHKITSHRIYDRILESPVGQQRDMLPLAQSQLGTVGSGNHYVDVLTDSDGFVWVACHFGSRGFGHKTATGFINLHFGRGWDERAGQGESMFSAPILLPLASPIGQDYFECMKIAGEYAYAGREEVVKKVLEILNTHPIDSVHNHHNFAWMENNKCVVRKGATPISSTLRGFVGGSMGDICVVIRGIDNAVARESLGSAMHGAGRVISRTKAAGKVKKRRVWVCGNYRDCAYQSPMREFKRGKHGERPKCPACGEGNLQERFVEERKSDGVVDWEWWKNKLEKDGIILVGGGADEAPQCYRPLKDVLNAHKDYVVVETIMTPKIVVMAGADVVDPFKD